MVPGHRSRRTGAFGDAEIDAELARDATIAGQEKAAGARAARPDAAAKEVAWESVVVRDDLPNETQRSIARAFQQPGQAEILQPYVARYLDTARTVIEKGVWRASEILESFFPRANPSAENLAAIDAWLAGQDDLDATTRRYVSEGRSDLARALAAQERVAAL